MKMLAAITALLIATTVHAQKAAVKLSDISTSDDTSIVIKKGAPDNAFVPPDYEVVADKDEINGEPNSDRKEAYASWKAACQEWKHSMREMNKDSTLMTLNCNAPSLQKEEYLFNFKSMGTYKMRVRIRDKKTK